MKFLLLHFILLMSMMSLYAQDSSSNVQYHDQVEAAALKSGKQASVKIGKKRPSKNKTASFFIALSILGLYGVMRLIHPKYIENLFNLIARSNLGKLAKTDALEREQMASIVFTFIYFFSCAYVVARVYTYFQSPASCSPTWIVLGISFGAVLFANFGKYLLVSTLAWIFRFSSASKPFFRHISYTNQLIGIILLPVCALFILCFESLNSTMAWFAGIFLAMTVIYKYLANYSYFKNLSGVSFFHFFLYLCALEILPIAMIVRWIGTV